MSRTLVAYLSLTGTTKAVAEAVFAAVEGEKDLLPLDAIGALDEYDLVFVGFPVQSHGVPYKAETFLRRIPAGKKIALFCTHGSLPGHRLSREAIEHAATLVAGTRLLGTFCVRGRISMQALDVLARSPEHAEWANMSASAASHPDAGDLAEAAAFARRMKILAAHGHY